MSRIQTINTKNAKGRAKELLDGVQENLGMTPNMMRTMAHSPAVLEAYLKASTALSSGILSAKLREKIALSVAQANDCNYCLAAHTAIGKIVGLSEEIIRDSRQNKSADRKEAIVLEFVQKMVADRGVVNDQDITRLRDIGCGDAEIVEIVANISLNIFTNYFNHVADPIADFPQAEKIQINA